MTTVSSSSGTKLTSFGESRPFNPPAAEWWWHMARAEAESNDRKKNATTSSSSSSTSTSSSLSIGYIIAGGVVGVIILAVFIRFFMNKRKMARLKPSLPSFGSFVDNSGVGGVGSDRIGTIE